MTGTRTFQTSATLSAESLSLVQSDRTVSVPLGPQRITREYFRHSPPTPVELEHAIQDIEDSLHPAYRNIGGGNLHMRYAELHGLQEFLRPAGTGARVLSRDELETAFSRLAALSEGRPSSQDPLPPDAHFAATLLIVRELMHHLDFSNLYLEKP